MGVRFIKPLSFKDDTAMYDGTSGIAFGPVAQLDFLVAFVVWLREEQGVEDARGISNGALIDHWVAFNTDEDWIRDGELTDAAFARMEDAE